MAQVLHIEHTLNLKVSKDTAGTQILINRNETAKFDQYREHVTNVFDLAASATDFAVPMGSIGNVQLLYIETEAKITVKINGIGSTPITIRPNPTGGSVGKFFLETESLTSIHLSNPGSAVVRVLIAMVGD